MSKDVLHALRALRQHPGFTVVAALCLALGIGVNTSVFSFINLAFFRPLPVAAPDRLVRVYRSGAQEFSFPDYRDFRDRNQALSGLAGTNLTESSLDFNGRSSSAAAEPVTVNYGEVTGVRPVIGRWFLPREDRAGGVPPMVISYRTWQAQFGGDPAALGKRVRSETQWYIIVGVAPKSFQGMFIHIPTDLWVPLQAWTSQYEDRRATLENRQARTLLAFGRLKPAVSMGQARANLEAIGRQLHPQSSPVIVEPADGIFANIGRRQALPILTLLLGVVSLILLIACVNIANLLLARAASRRREIAIRFALGANRSQIVRQMLTESAVLAFLGAASGLVLARWANQLLASSLPMRPDLSPDYRVFLFTLAVTAGATLLFGLTPAISAARTGVLLNLRGSSPISPGSERFHLRQLSVVAQVALSLVLLFTAGVFLKALMAFESADPGFQTRGRLFAQVFISPPEYNDTTGPAFYGRLGSFVRTLPQVKSAGLTTMLPLSYPVTECVSVGATEAHPGASVIDGGFLDTMGIRLLQGRNFNAADGPGAPAVVLINGEMARRQWPGQSALGQHIRIGPGCREGRGVKAEIVGVVANSRWASLLQSPESHVYQPLGQNYGGLTTLVVDTGDDSGARAELLRRQLVDFEPSLRVYAIQPLRQHVDASYFQVRWEAAVLGGFGVLALSLAAVGLYGVIAYTTTQRTHEISVRLALGALRRDIIRLVVAHVLALSLAGIAIGWVLSLALTRPLQALLYGLNPADAGTLIAVALLWLLIAGVAGYLPARRAASVDPMLSLRYE